MTVYGNRLFAEDGHANGLTEADTLFLTPFHLSHIGQRLPVLIKESFQGQNGTPTLIDCKYNPDHKSQQKHEKEFGPDAANLRNLLRRNLLQTARGNPSSNSGLYFGG